MFEKHGMKVALGYLVAGVLVHLYTANLADKGKPHYGGTFTSATSPAWLVMGEGIVLWPVALYKDLAGAPTPPAA